jgi:hypothetical protein
MLRFGISGCGEFMENAVIPMLVRAEMAEVVTP